MTNRKLYTGYNFQSLMQRQDDKNDANWIKYCTMMKMMVVLFIDGGSSD